MIDKDGKEVTLRDAAAFMVGVVVASANFTLMDKTKWSVFCEVTNRNPELLENFIIEFIGSWLSQVDNPPGACIEAMINKLPSMAMSGERLLKFITDHKLDDLAGEGPVTSIKKFIEFMHSEIQ